MDIRVRVTVIRTVACNCYLEIMIVYDILCVCVCVRYQAWVSVWLAVESLHVLDLCLQQCLCVRMHYGCVHDYIQ